MRRVTGLRVGRVLLSAALVVSIAGCGSGGLGQKVIDALPGSDAGSASLALDSIADGGWDHYLVVCPYETTSSVEERLGFWADAPDLSTRDDRQAIVLVGSGEIVDHAVLDRSAVDLCVGSRWELMARTTPIEVSWSAESAMWTGQPAGTGDRTSP